MTKSSALDAVQNLEVPTEVTFKLASPRVTSSADTKCTGDANKIPRVGGGGHVFKRTKPYKPHKSSQPQRLLLKFRKPQIPSRLSKSDDECRHSDSLFSEEEDDESSSFGQRLKAPKALSLSLSDLSVQPSTHE